MTLTMRPTGLGHGFYKDKVDYSVFAGTWNIGRIYERHGSPADVRFFWSLHGVVLTRPPPEIPTDGREPTFKMAKARLKRSWDRWLVWSARLAAAPASDSDSE